MGGNTAKVAKEDLENKLGEYVITNENMLNYKYNSDNKLEDKNEKI